MTGSIRVLVVDDDKLTRLGIISYMPWERHGMTVVGDVQNGEKALEFLARTRADLVFVDLDMPVMDGLTFIERSLEEFPGLQYVVLTFHEDFSYVQRVLRLGVLDYISKMQLEAEDGGQVLARIRARLEDFRASTAEAPPAAEPDLVDPTVWESLRARLDQQFWIYSHDAFRELAEELGRTPLPPRSLEHLAARIQHGVETSLGFSAPPPPAFHSGRDLAAWLEGYRRALGQELLRRTDLNDFAVAAMQATAYIDEHIDSSLNADEVAARVNLSRSYFSILFKKMTGVTYNEFVRRRRVEAARELLVRGELPVPDVAQRVGYEDVGYFTKVFAKHVGITPAEYRKRAQAPR